MCLILYPRLFYAEQVLTVRQTPFQNMYLTLQLWYHYKTQDSYFYSLSSAVQIKGDFHHTLDGGCLIKYKHKFHLSLNYPVTEFSFSHWNKTLLNVGKLQLIKSLTGHVLCSQTAKALNDTIKSLKYCVQKTLLSHPFLNDESDIQDQLPFSVGGGCALIQSVPHRILFRKC